MNQIPVKGIVRVLGVSNLAVYDLLKWYRDRGSIDLDYIENCGSKASVTLEQLKRIAKLIAQQLDITLEEIRETLNLPIHKSQINVYWHRMGYLFKNIACKRTKTSECSGSKRGVGRETKHNESRKPGVFRWKRINIKYCSTVAIEKANFSKKLLTYRR